MPTTAKTDTPQLENDKVDEWRFLYSIIRCRSLLSGHPHHGPHSMVPDRQILKPLFFNHRNFPNIWDRFSSIFIASTSNSCLETIDHLPIVLTLSPQNEEFHIGKEPPSFLGFWIFQWPDKKYMFWNVTRVFEGSNDTLSAFGREEMSIKTSTSCDSSITTTVK
ncbi:hypothetical protein RF11_04748 [Thelohanellus kitauei]|uniref:Uncharacterized protein n=1 Tax=Thelohanellus kitauei TaxID=669202 RepID=A0A0C2JP49_THEKT|nr:hypothetical protein RF11_04748 [Thelohanellus kitauei]